MRRKFFQATLIVFLCLSNFALTAKDVHASVVSPSDLISWMNANRVANGFPAMSTDSRLNDSAASAAYAMYQNGGCAHPGGKLERIAATGYASLGAFFATENMACATSATLDWFQQYNVWGDPIHQLPATDAQYTRVGAFAYSAPNGTTYYIMHAATDPTSIDPSSGSSGSSGNSEAAATADLSNFVQPVFTATPNSDGDTYHVVLYGQSLFAIATWYGVTVDMIKELNSLTSDAIYEGQKLLISVKPTPTITPTRTATVPQPTRTPTSTKAPPTPAPTITVTPTPAPSIASTLEKIDRQYLGFTILLISAIGFLIVLLKSFLKPIPKK